MNWKTIFIQSLINENSFNDYLELGIGNGKHFRQIKCKNKTGVDITVSGNEIITCDTDQFFKDNNKEYDCIFIDACHEVNYVRNDFVNSFKILKENGIIILHDINAWTKEECEPLGPHGDCYKFWLDLCDKYPDLTKTKIGTHGYNGKDSVGLFFKNNLKTIYDFLEITNHTFEDLEKNRNKYLFEKQI